MQSNTTIFSWKEFYWKSIEKNIEKINIDIINWEKLFDRPADCK